MAGKTQNVMAAIDYIEAHLDQKLDLEQVAEAVHYSKYYLHRMFTAAVGLTVHDYVQRRQLTEAAKLLVFSRRPIAEIAQLAGYASQQAFTDAFKAMYKKAPGQFREEEAFYPLQLAFVLQPDPALPETDTAALADSRCFLTLPPIIGNVSSNVLIPKRNIPLAVTLPGW